MRAIIALYETGDPELCDPTRTDTIVFQGGEMVGRGSRTEVLNMDFAKKGRTGGLWFEDVSLS